MNTRTHAQKLDHPCIKESHSITVNNIDVTKQPSNLLYNCSFDLSTDWFIVGKCCRESSHPTCHGAKSCGIALKYIPTCQ